MTVTGIATTTILNATEFQPANGDRALQYVHYATTTTATEPWSLTVPAKLTATTTATGTVPLTETATLKSNATVFLTPYSHG